MELTAEIVSIGKELLLGSIQNKNASFLAAGLTKLGIRVMRSIDIEDEVPLLVNVWKECFSRVDIVICSGGMGLTLDDGTKAAAAAFLKVGLIQSPEIAEFLQTKQEWSHLFQAYETVPQGAFVFINPVGLAPGLGFSLDQKLLILLPGVPREVEALWTQKIAPYLQEKIGNRLAIYRETIHLVLLAEERVDPFLRKVQQMFPLVEVGIYPQKGDRKSVV